MKNNLIKLLVAIIFISIIILAVKAGNKTIPATTNTAVQETNTNVTTNTAVQSINTNVATKNTNAPSKNTGATAKNTENNIQDDIKKETKTVFIKEHSLNNTYINGIVKNNTENTVTNLKISADCYDKNGNKLANGVSYLDKLEPGETWNFKIYTYSNTKQYKNLKIEYK